MDAFDQSTRRLPLDGIVIDPSHGGDDPGASGNGIIEKDMTLAISLYQYDRFLELGLPVTITRTEDVTLTPEERVQKIMNAFGRSEDVLVISNHIHIPEGGEAEGAEIIYALRNTDRWPNRIMDALEASGQTVQLPYQRRLPSDLSKDYYAILRDTAPLHTIMIEYGHLDNPADAARLKQNYKLYAEAVVKGTLEYLGIPYRPVEGSDTYTVQPGDSLWKIANSFGISVELLKSANNLSSNDLYVGQILKIPSPIEEPDTGDFIVYVVQPNDSLWKIANQYQTTVQALIDFNRLSSTDLQVGQQILIPRSEINQPDSDQDIFYTVKNGDSLWKIANQFDTTVEELRRYNQLSSNILQIGQVLRIPRGSTVTPPNDQEDTPTYITYTVRLNDSLWKIANQFGTTVEAIKAANGLTSNSLDVGQVLRIPSSNGNSGTSGTRYIVKRDDSLWKIANQFGTTVEEIKQKNQLTSNNLEIGQVLYI